MVVRRVGRTAVQGTAASQFPLNAHIILCTPNENLYHDTHVNRKLIPFLTDMNNIIDKKKKQNKKKKRALWKLTTLEALLLYSSEITAT